MCKIFRINFFDSEEVLEVLRGTISASKEPLFKKKMKKIHHLFKTYYFLQCNTKRGTVSNRVAFFHTIKVYVDHGFQIIFLCRLFLTINYDVVLEDRKLL